MIFLYAIILIFLTIVSYSLIDVNLTLFNNRYWAIFRQQAVNLGYFHRELNSIIYLVAILLLFFFNWYFVTRYKKVNLLLLSILIVGICLFSYPFLSHDLFNYIFDAKILTFYHKLPYFYIAQQFPRDPWLRFLQWTDRTYPYGPTFLWITAIPSILSFNKFVLDFFLFKLMWVVFYLAAIFALSKMNKKWAVLFATYPLVIVDGLINTHNDLIMVSSAIIGLYFLMQKRQTITGRIFLLFSAGIKYLTLPLVFIIRKNTKITNSVFLVFLYIMLYLSFTREIQPWYFLSFFAFLPFYADKFAEFNLFGLGLLVSNYFFIRYGDTNQLWQISQKTTVIFIFLIINLGYLFIKYVIRQNPSKNIQRITLGLLLTILICSRFINLFQSAPWGKDQLNLFPPLVYSIIKDPVYLTGIVPILFVIGALMILKIKCLDFYEKLLYIFLVAFSWPFLSLTRSLTQINLTFVILFILINGVSVFWEKKPFSLRIFIPKNIIAQTIIVALMTLFVAFNFIGYFSSSTGVNTIEINSNIAGQINYYHNKWYADEKIKGHVWPRINTVQLTAYPEGSDTQGIEYLLHNFYGLDISGTTGKQYFICYEDVCKNGILSLGKEQKKYLALPKGKTLLENDIIFLDFKNKKASLYVYR